MQWNTQRIIEALKEKLPFEVDISIGEPGGDVDTNGVYVTPEEDGDYWISIYGFLTGGYLDEERDDCEIDLVEIRDYDSDSSGGIQTKELNNKILAAHVQQIVEDLGYTCVPQMDNYF